MVNYDDLPLFPLHVVLYPDIPLPLHIFEPRYRLMITRCREENSPFGIALIQGGETDTPHPTGTTARITQYEERPDGRMNIVVVGETRFHIRETHRHRPYLTGQVEPFWEQPASAETLGPAAQEAAGLFRDYLKTLCALTGRALSALQLPQEPEYLSYAIASTLQISLPEKQRLLEMTATDARLRREIEILRRERDSLRALMSLHRDVQVGADSITLPVDTLALGRLSSLN